VIPCPLSLIWIDGSGEIGAAEACVAAPAIMKPAKAAKMTSFDMVAGLSYEDVSA
jgi:hypothetical protein